jgi:hypothetical protein
MLRKRRFCSVAMIAAVSAIVTIATPVLACPVCGANDGATWSTLALVGGMITIPYVVAAVAIKAIRRIDNQTAAGAKPAETGPRP